MSGRARHEAVEKRVKDLIAECETDKMYRCSVPAFHRGLEYYRIRQMMIRDVRLVYAPSDKIGNFGGDIDNYEWPRHTGDYSFLRAYVGKDGRPADPSPDNVPYQSKDFLVVSAEGIKAGDGILLAGYPGRTSRYKLPSEIRYARDTAFPLKVTELQADLAVMADATAWRRRRRRALCQRGEKHQQRAEENPGPARRFRAQGHRRHQGRAGCRVPRLVRQAAERVADPAGRTGRGDRQRHGLERRRVRLVGGHQ